LVKKKVKQTFRKCKKAIKHKNNNVFARFDKKANRTGPTNKRKFEKILISNLLRVHIAIVYLNCKGFPVFEKMCLLLFFGGGREGPVRVFYVSIAGSLRGWH
jgi:hypothetical protein